MKKWSTLKKKLRKVMRICVVQGMMAMLVCGMALAHTNYAQVLDRKVTLTLNDVPLENALKEIEVAAKIKFVYSPDQLNPGEKISIKAEKRTLRDLLDELLMPCRIRYKVHEKEATITLKREASDEKASLLAEVTYNFRRMQAAIITGTVTDATTQQPIAGVNVLVKGTSRGTSTDAAGKYSLQAEDNDVLVFSFIGYKTTEALAGSRLVIDVALEEDIASLDEVVINAGYWQVTDKERTGNIAKVGSKDIRKQPVQNALAALQGRVTGLEITQSTGVPGGNFKVRIRGTNSIANGNDPLYVIDGVPFISSSMSFLATSGNILGDPNAAGSGSSPLNSINPADIESIEVLKDADATAIYGSRGSNGVILITTKKGQAGKTKVDFNFYTGAAQVSHKVDLLDLRQYLGIRKEAFANDGITPTAANAPDLMVWDTTRYTDWQKELIGGTANTTDAQVSVSGGEKYTQFSFGVGYHKETTVFPGDNSDQRVSTHINITNTSPNQKLKTTLSVNYSVNNSDLLSRDLTERALTLSPDAPKLYDENGNLSWTNWTSSFENPLAYLDRRYEGNTYNLIGNAMMRYLLLPNLEIKSSFGYTNTSMKAVSLVPVNSLSPDATQVNSSNFSNSSFQNWIVEPQVSWKPKLGEGNFDVLMGTTFLNQITEGLSQYASGFTSEALMKNIAAAPNRIVGTNYYAQYRYQAVFGRINYSWKEKYIVNLTGRRDGSSRFGPGKRFASFGAVGAAWIFSEEGFVKNHLSFLSFGKLRSSYGITGNDQLSDYQYLDAYTISGSGYYQTGNGLTPARLSNPDFAWETNRKFEAGLELGFLDNRILSSASFYQNRSSNQLVGFPLPTTTGFTSIQGNFPAVVQNKGIEIELSAHNIEKKDFSWSTTFNISIPRNKLIEFPNLSAFPAYANRYVVGEPLSIAKLYHYTGLDPTTGSYTFEDVNDDGSYDFEDRQTVKFLGQDFYGGLLNSFQYKGFQLDILFQFINQTGYDRFWGVPGYYFSNQHISVADHWQEAGDNAIIPKASTLSGLESNLFLSSDQIVIDASFIRIKNLSLSYTVPLDYIRKLHISNARIFIQGQNLFTITNYQEVLDPETMGSILLPPLRTLTAGIHLTF